MRFFIFLVPGKVPVCRLLGSTRNFRPEVPGSTRKFLDQPGSSWFNQEDPAFSKTVFVFNLKVFLLMGPFSITRNEPWSKNAKSCLKITNNNSFFLGSCSLHILLTTPNPFQENNYIVRELRKGFKMEFP